MDLLEHLAKARDIQSTRAADRRKRQVFHFCWRGAGSEIVVGWAAAAKLLGLKENTLASRLSASGNNYCVTRINPLTNEPDALTVTKTSPAKVAEQAKRGRKPKLLDIDLLGSEALYDVRTRQTRRRR